MKKFRFRLEPIMKYREFLERQKQLEVARARSDVLDCEQSLEKTRTAFSKAVENLEADLDGGMTAARFLHIRDYISRLESFEVSEEKRRKELLKILTRRQKELAKKAVEKKAMEKLRAKRKEEYYTAILKEEQKTMDDTMILRQAGSTEI